jgi:hypothetical protein
MQMRAALATDTRTPNQEDAPNTRFPGGHFEDAVYICVWVCVCVHICILVFDDIQGNAVKDSIR